EGRGATADRILSATAKLVQRFEAAGDRQFDTQIDSARIAAVAGSGKKASRILLDAVARGWKGQDIGSPDPELDPAFDTVRSDPDFQSAMKLLRESQRAEAERLAKVDLSGI